MSEPTRDAYQGEVDKTHASLAIDGVEYGTVGWINVDALSDVGTGGDDADDGGPTLVRVTLYRGKLPGGDPLVGIAEGLQILALVMGPLYQVPPRGKRVAIAWPEKRPMAPALILGVVGATPDQQFSETRAVLDVGPDAALVIKGKSVTLMDHMGDSGGFGAWLAVGPVGNDNASTIYATDGAGGVLTISQNAAGLAVGDGNGGVAGAITIGGPNASTSGFGVVVNNAGFITLDTSGNWNMSGQTCAIGTGTISLGAEATPGTPVLLGVTGMAGVGSLTLFGQP